MPLGAQTPPPWQTKVSFTAKVVTGPKGTDCKFCQAALGKNPTTGKSMFFFFSLLRLVCDTLVGTWWAGTHMHQPRG